MNENIIQLLRLALTGSLMTLRDGDSVTVLDIDDNAQLVCQRQGPRKREGAFVVDPKDATRY